jgi:hypothetical protein
VTFHLAPAIEKHREVFHMIHIKVSSAYGSPGKVKTGVKSIDASTAATEIPNGRNASQKMPQGTTESCQDDTDRKAIERGEDEGMK